MPASNFWICPGVQAQSARLPRTVGKRNSTARLRGRTREVLLIQVS
jgi:hypothetical protein